MKNNPLHYMIFLILAFCLIKKSYQIFYILDPHETRCISKLILENSTFSGAYFVSGESEQNNNAVIKNPNKEIIWKDNGHSNGSFSLEVQKEGKIFNIFTLKISFHKKKLGVYSLCIESTSDEQLTISFDFHDEKHSKHLSVRKKIYKIK